MPLDYLTRSSMRLIHLQMTNAARITLVAMFAVLLLLLTGAVTLTIGYVLTNNSIHRTDRSWCNTIAVIEKDTVHSNLRVSLAELGKEFKCGAGSLWLSADRTYTPG